MNTIPRIAVIGAGGHASKVHIPLLHKLAREGLCTLVKIIDIDIDRAKSAYTNFHFETYGTDTKNMSHENVDLLYVFGSAQMHYEYAKTFLAKGIAVCIEKPLTDNTTQLLELINIAKKNNTQFFCALNRRYMDVVVDVKSYLLDSAISTIEARFNYNFFKVLPKFNASSWISSNSIHALDLILFFKDFKSPEMIYTVSNTLSNGVDSNYTTILKWNDKSSAVFVSNNEAGMRSEQYTIHTANATYIFDRTSLEIWRDGQLFLKKEYTKDQNGFEAEHRYFISEVSKIAHIDMSVLLTMKVCQYIETNYSGTITDGVDTVQVVEIDKKLPVESILVLNPTGISSHLVMLSKKYNIIFEETLTSLSQENRQKIVAIITGNKGSPLSSEILILCPAVKVVGIVGASLKKFNPENKLGQK